MINDYYNNIERQGNAAIEPLLRRISHNGRLYWVNQPGAISRFLQLKGVDVILECNPQQLPLAFELKTSVKSTMANAIFEEEQEGSIGWAARPIHPDFFAMIYLGSMECYIMEWTSALEFYQSNRDRYETRPHKKPRCDMPSINRLIPWADLADALGFQRIARFDLNDINQSCNDFGLFMMDLQPPPNKTHIRSV